MHILTKSGRRQGGKVQDFLQDFDMQTMSAQDIDDTVREGLVVLDGQFTVVSANRCFFELFSVLPEQTVGRRIYDLGDGQWNIPALRRLLEDILPEQRNIELYEVDHVFPTVGRKIINLNARKIHREGNHVEHVLMTFCDVTDIRDEQVKAARAANVTLSIVDKVRDPIVILDQELRITLASRNFLRLFGDKETDVIGKRIDMLKEGQWDVPASQRNWRIGLKLIIRDLSIRSFRNTSRGGTLCHRLSGDAKPNKRCRKSLRRNCQIEFFRAG